MPDSPSTTPQRQQPVHEIRLGAIKAAIWKNETENGPRFNSTFSRIYRNGDEWKSTDSFGRDDLLVLAKVADLAHSWITQPEPDEDRSDARTKKGSGTDLTDKSLPKRPSQGRAGA